MTLLRSTPRLLITLLMPLALWGCLLTPGKFVSTISVNADRSFAFTYKGEVIAIEPSMPSMGGADGKTGEGKPADATSAKPDPAAEAETDTKNREIAAALAKEEGYRSVVYRGKGKFDIDYAISGKLTHGFVFPFNTDGQAVFPFIAVELRQGGIVRVKAPGFANSTSDASGMGAMGGGSGPDASKYLDGTFTLDTDAEIISQNNEDGAKPSGGRKTISWRATPLTKDAPTAVLRLGR